jgi:fumarylpyruvate hydrolase
MGRAMTDLLFPVPDWPVLPVAGLTAGYPVRRIFCVGRNYAAHAAEMGNEVERDAPFYFTKSPLAVVPGHGTLAYPPGTVDYHHEVELVLALGAPVFRVAPDAAAAAVLAYGVGLDMTRRDLQGAAKARRLPWDLGKDVEGSAVLGGLTQAAAFGAVGPQRIWLSVNGAPRQAAHLADMVWSVPEIVSHLSGFYHLGPGDLIMTGTPAGVGPVEPGDRIEAGIDGLDPLDLRVGARP